MMRFKHVVSCALAVGLLGSVAAQAETFRLSSWLPPTHPIVADMIKPWAKQVADATDGRVQITVLPKALGNPPSHFDLAKDGIADITYGVTTYSPGRFTLTKMAEMPFLGESAVANSVAYWRMYKKHLEQVGEFDGVVTLSVFTHGPGGAYNAVRPIEKIADFEGLKIRVGGSVAGDVANAVGVVPMLKPAPASYELMSNGVADGVFFPQESIAAFKLTKLVRYGTLVPDGLYNVSFFLAMNPKSFNKLSKADQEAMLRVSGEHFARIAGKAWDAADDRANKKMKEDGVQLITASPELVAQIRDVVAPIEKDWIEYANSKGLDGAAVLTEFRAEIEKVEAGN